MLESARIIARVAGAEGLRATTRRIADRAEERWWSWLARPGEPLHRNTGVLNVVGTPLARRLGGVQVQLVARLAAERRMRPIALLHPSSSGFHLTTFGAAIAHGTNLAANRSFVEVVAQAASLVGAVAVHVEGPSGIAPTALASIPRTGLTLLLSVHDLALWCARSNGFEEPTHAFCDISRDLARCARCLTASAIEDDSATRRRIGAETLAAARALVFPSGFVRDQHRRLFPGPRNGPEVVIEPASGAERCSRKYPRAHRTMRSIAFVGNVTALKGGGLLGEMIDRCEVARVPVRWHLFGGGDPTLLAGLKRKPNVVVHGYHRVGTLPQLLGRHHVELALTPSLVPEAFQLTLSECWLAGVPVIAFDHGAVRDRIHVHGGGVLVPVHRGAAGMAATVERVLRGEIRCPPPPPPECVPTAAQAATAHVRLYAELGLLGSTRVPRAATSAGGAAA